MKKFTKINYILTFILVFCIGATLPILIGSSHVDEQHSAKSEVPYCVTSPTVPEQVTFDGETIDLRRYDRRERMDREMMAFTYMHPGYYSWILNSDFTLNTKAVLTKIRLREMSNLITK